MKLWTRIWCPLFDSLRQDITQLIRLRIFNVRRQSQIFFWILDLGDVSNPVTVSISISEDGWSSLYVQPRDYDVRKAAQSRHLSEMAIHLHHAFRR